MGLQRQEGASNSNLKGWDFVLGVLGALES